KAKIGKRNNINYPLREHLNLGPERSASEGWRRTMIGHGGKPHGIVDPCEVCRLVLPAAAAVRKLFPFRLKSIHPLFQDRGFVQSLLKRPITVAVLGHRSHLTGPE